MKNSKPAYFIFSVNVTNPEGLKPYQDNVGETVKAYGGQLIVQEPTRCLLKVLRQKEELLFCDLIIPSRLMPGIDPLNIRRLSITVSPRRKRKPG